MVKRCLLFIALLLAFKTSYANQPTRAVIKSGEDLLYNDPQKGIAYFQNLLKQYPMMPDTVKGHLYGMIGAGFAMGGELDSAIFHLNQCVILNLPGRSRVVAMKTLGAVYRLNKEFYKADSVLSNAVNLLDDSPDGRNLKSILLGEIATVHIDQGANHIAINLLKQGLFISRSSSNPDTITQSVLKSKLAVVYFYMENYSMAASEVVGLLPMVNPKNNLYNYYANITLLARSYLEMGQPQNAKQWLLKSEEAAKKLNNKEFEGYVFMLYGQYYYLNTQQDKALTNFQQSFDMLKEAQSTLLLDCVTEYLKCLAKYGQYQTGMKIINDPQLKEPYFSDASIIDRLKFKRSALSIIVHSGTTSEIANAYKEIIPLIDSVTSLKMQQSLLDAKSEFKLAEKEKEKQQLEVKNKYLVQENKLRNSQIGSVILALSALLLLVAFIVVRHRNKSLKQQQELERTKQEVTLKEQRLELESKIRMLREKVIKQQKTELLKSVDEIGQLKSELEKASDATKKNIEESLIKQLLEPKNKIGLEQFLHQFNSIFPNFFSELSKKYPEMSTPDLQFCALVRMNLSFKDISNILHIELKSTYQKKYRIEQKMDLDNDTTFERAIFDIAG